MKNSSSDNPSSPIPFPTGKTPSASPTSPPQQTQRELIEQAVSSLALEIIQLKRTLWLVLNQTGPQVLDETRISPLWRINPSREDGNKLRLEAVEMEPPSSHQMSKLADALDGTMTPLEEAMDAAELAAYPPAYIEMMLRSRVVRADTGYWVDATLHEINQSPPSDTN